MELRGGTASEPIVFYGERKNDGSLDVHFRCSTNGSDDMTSCFNIDKSDYIAIDGFILEGGAYGVRSFGEFETGGALTDRAERQNGVSILNSRIFDQEEAPIFAATSDWVAIESNVVFGSTRHGILLTSGSDWNVVRYNEVYGNTEADLRIDGFPKSMCTPWGVSLSNNLCAGSARNGNGQGVSEFFTISQNFLHDGGQYGPNFTSIRNSKISHNIIGPYQGTGTAFWQQTDVADLGSYNNDVLSNLFVGHTGFLVRFASNVSTSSLFSSNIVLALNRSGSDVNPNFLVLDVSDGNVVYTNNFYFSGSNFEHTLDPSETHQDELPEDLFSAGFARTNHPEDWTPKAGELGGWKPPILSKFPSRFSR